MQSWPKVTAVAPQSILLCVCVFVLQLDASLPQCLDAPQTTRQRQQQQQQQKAATSGSNLSRIITYWGRWGNNMQPRHQAGSQQGKRATSAKGICTQTNLGWVKGFFKNIFIEQNIFTASISFKKGRNYSLKYACIVFWDLNIFVNILKLFHTFKI